MPLLSFRCTAATRIPGQASLSSTNLPATLEHGHGLGLVLQHAELPPQSCLLGFMGSLLLLLSRGSSLRRLYKLLLQLVHLPLQLC